MFFLAVVIHNRGLRELALGGFGPCPFLRIQTCARFLLRKVFQRCALRFRLLLPLHLLGAVRTHPFLQEGRPPLSDGCPFGSLPQGDVV